MPETRPDGTPFIDQKIIDYSVRLIVEAPRMAELLRAVAFDEHGQLQHWMEPLYATNAYVKRLADSSTAILARVRGTDA